MNQVPALLRQTVERDLRPVRPLRPAWVRALALLPLAALALVEPVFRYSLRRDVGFSLSWGLSALEVAAGILLVAVGLKNAVPGQESSRRSVRLIAAGVMLVVAVSVLTDVISATKVPPGELGFFNTWCFEQSALLGIPAVGLAALLAGRALPIHPALVGALYGMGGGLFADAGWRMFCDVSEPAHVLIAHGGAVLALTVAGAGMSVLIERHRRNPK